MKDEDDVTELNVPYHTIIIDCAPITFVDSMGTRALYQVTDCFYRAKPYVWLINKYCKARKFHGQLIFVYFVDIFHPQNN